MTGYTYQLQNSGYNVKKWLSKDIPRGFGLFVSLRDEGELSVEEMKEHLKKSLKEEIRYYVDSEKDAGKRLEKAKKMTDDEIRAVMKKEKKELEKANKISEDERRDTVSQLKKSLIKVEKLIRDLKKKEGTKLEDSESPEKITLNMFEFAKEQLEVSIDYVNVSYKSEYSFHTPEEWLKDEIEDAERDIERATTKIAEEKEKCSKAIKIYKKYLQYVERLDSIYGEKLKEF